MIEYKAPSNLSKKTTKYVSMVYDFLKESEVYKDIDACILDQLAIYIEAFDQYKTAILETGIVLTDLHGKFKDNPLNKKMNDCQIQLLKILQELGLTPKAREKITLDIKTGELTPFEKFLRDEE